MFFSQLGVVRSDSMGRSTPPRARSTTLLTASVWLYMAGVAGVALLLLGLSDEW